MKKMWFYIAILCILISIFSLFTSIITYTANNGEISEYSIIELLEGEKFSDTVLMEYTGKVVWDINGSTVTVLVIIAIVSLLCAVTALVTLRAQYPNRWQFVLAIMGLIGISIPSILVIIAVFLLKNYFRGTIKCGLSPVITPIAMIICIVAVLRRRNKVLKDLQAKMRAKGLIKQAEDLI